MKTPICTLLLIIFVGLNGSGSWAQAPVDSLTQDSLDLMDLAQPIKLAGDANFASFSLLDSSVSDYQFFFTGEEHYQKINTRLQWQFLRYLHQRAGVRTLILETGFSYSVLINAYLKTGNDKLLNKALAVSPICPENHRKLFRLIRRYNESLPATERIYVLGIDLEYEPELSLQALNYLMPHDDYPKSIARDLKKLRKLHRSRYYEEGEVRRLFKRLQADMETNIDAHLLYWGDNFPTAAYIVDNTVRGQVFGSFQLVMREILEDKSLWAEREQRMFENFLLLRQHVPEGNYYGQFGTLHAFLSPIYWEFPSLARKLNTRKDSPVQGKVLSIVRYIPDLVNTYYEENERTLIGEVVDYVEQSYPGNVVLTRLTRSLAPLEPLSQYMLIIDPELQEPSCE